MTRARHLWSACIHAVNVDQNFYRIFPSFLAEIRIVPEKLPIIIVNGVVFPLPSSNRLAEREKHEKMRSGRFKAVKNAAIFRPIKYRNGAEKWETVRFRPTHGRKVSPRVSARYPRQKYGRNYGGGGGGGGGWFNGGLRRFVSSFLTDHRFIHRDNFSRLSSRY